MSFSKRAQFKYQLKNIRGKPDNVLEKSVELITDFFHPLPELENLHEIIKHNDETNLQHRECEKSALTTQSGGIKFMLSLQDLVNPVKKQNLQHIRESSEDKPNKENIILTVTTKLEGSPNKQLKRKTKI